MASLVVLKNVVSMSESSAVSSIVGGGYLLVQ